MASPEAQPLPTGRSAPPPKLVAFHIPTTMPCQAVLDWDLAPVATNTTIVDYTPRYMSARRLLCGNMSAMSMNEISGFTTICSSLKGRPSTTE